MCRGGRGRCGRGGRRGLFVRRWGNGLGVVGGGVGWGRGLLGGLGGRIG